MPDIQPFVIGIWSGIRQPNDLNEFLKPFVEDIDNAIKNQIIVNGYRIEVEIRCFICDSPARSFLKGSVFLFNYFNIETCF